MFKAERWNELSKIWQLPKARASQMSKLKDTPVHTARDET